MSGLDSLAIDSEKPFEIVLRNPQTNQPLRDAEGTAAYVTVFGQDSAAAQKAKRDATQNALSRRNRQMNATELEAQNIEFLTAVTTGWHLVNFDGEVVDFPFSPANARKLYGTASFNWIKEQIDEAVGDRSNFLKKSASK